MRAISRAQALVVLAVVAGCGSDSSGPVKEIEGGVPAAVRAAITGSTVQLHWDPVPGAIGYKVYMAEVGGVKRTNVTQLIGNMTHSHGGTAFDHPSGLVASSDYYFVVTAVHPGNAESKESCEVSAKIATNKATTC